MDQAINYANYLKAIPFILVLPLDICNIIVKYTTDQETIDEAVQLASRYGHLDVVIFLHAHGADITADAVRWASHFGNIEVIKWLHANGADFNQSASS